MVMNARHRSPAGWAILALAFASVAIWFALRSRSSGEIASSRAATSSSIADGMRMNAVSGVTSAALVEAGSSTWFVEDSASPITLSGRVFVDGKGARDVTVELSDDVRPGGASPRRSVKTGPHGDFRFEGVTRLRGSYRVVAYAAGHAPAWALSPGDASRDDLELRVEECKLHVYGTVTDASGGHVGGASVFLEHAPDHRTSSDDTGRYRLCIGPARARLIVSAAGYGIWMRRVLPRGDLRVDVALLPAARVAGMVVFANSGDRAAFARVALRAEGEVFAEALADAQGDFVLRNVSPGAYTLVAQTRSARTKAPLDVAVFASASAHVTVRLEQRATVTGRVSSEGIAVPNLSVSLGYPSTSEWSSAVRTLEDGTFAVHDVPIGERVRAEVADHEVFTPHTFTIPPAGLDGVALEVRAKAELAVVVTRAGTPVRDAVVFARGPIKSEQRSSSASGAAVFRGLDTGTYRVIAEDAGDFAVAENVQITRGAKTSVSVQLATGPRIQGRLVDERDADVDGARISFVPTSRAEDTGASAVTAPDGRFRGGPLRGPAVYRIRVVRSGAVLDAKEEFPLITVSADGQANPRELRLVVKANDKRLTGRVVDVSGGAARDVRLTLTRPERHSEVMATAFTGNDGVFAFRDVGSGPFALRAVAPDGAEAEVKPLTAPKDDIGLTLQGVGAVRGTLVGFARTPSLMAWSVAGYSWDFHPAVIEDDHFTIVGVPRGKHHIAATTSQATAFATFDIEANEVRHIVLTASGQRTVHGKTLDFITGKPLPDMTCQAAPYVADARSPVVVPGAVTSDENGDFELANVPAASLYIWCSNEARFRGGASRIPENLEGPLRVWGLDVQGRRLETQTLGMTFAEDHPFSRAIATVEPKGAAERSGIRVGDAIDAVDGRPVTEGGNGLARSFLAYLLLDRRSVPLLVRRGDAVVAITFTL